MKILFFGTPRFAEIVLEKLLEHHEVVGVVCQNDKPSGRGKNLSRPHIVQMAEERGIKTFQFEKLSEHLEDFKKIDCDLGVTASYGKFIPKSLLEILPIVNVHPSLLPKLRGATPIQSALLGGQKVTGVTIMKTDVGMDDGEIYAQKEVEIFEEDDYISLHDRLAEVGADLLLETLQKIERGEAKLTPQEHEKATFCKLIKKEDAKLDFSLSAKELVCRVKAYAEDPVAYFFVGGQRIKVHKAKMVDENDQILQNLKKSETFGEILCTKKRFLVSTAKGILEIMRCQGEGGKVLDAAAFLNGYHFRAMVVDV